MVRMSDVWDRASDVIARRRGDLASIALLFIWLPGLLRTVAGIAVRGTGIGTATGPVAASAADGGALFLDVVGLAAILLGLVGQLALVALASDPGIDRAAALRVARRRFWPYVGIMALVVVGFVVLIVPLMIALAGAYPGLAAMQAGVPPQIAPGTGLFVLLYSVALMIVIFWVEARLLILLTPVVVNERLGIGTFRRAWALTRGLTWRIIGVLLLFGVVALVAFLAVQGVVGVTLRLLLGASQAGLALFLTAAAVSLVSCVVSVVAAAFTAQLFLAVAGMRPRA